MGYWMMQVGSEFFIAQEDQYDALSALWQWMRDFYRRYSDDTYRQALAAQTLAEALAYFDWELTEDDMGNTTGITYKRSRYTPLPTFFYDIAPYVRSGSYILMRHDNMLFPGNGIVETRYTFTGDTVITEQTATDDFPSTKPKQQKKGRRR